MCQLLTYDKVVLYRPKMSIVHSRSECDTSTEFLGYKFKIPVVPANMPSVIDLDLCTFLAKNGYFYILHRYYSYEEISCWIKRHQDLLISISVGVKTEDKIFILDLVRQKLKVDIITIDIACGHSLLCKEMIEFIKENLPSTKIIAGNICTLQAAKDFKEWGADAVKAGIAQGGACSTYHHTGFMSPMFSLAVDMGQSPLPVILDGGIRSNGDITKALVACTQWSVILRRSCLPVMVMAGSLFAACKDAPGENISTMDVVNDVGAIGLKERIIAKKYYGNASRTNKEKVGQEVKHVEGFDIEIPYNGMTYQEKLEEIEQDLQSAISYAGGKNLGALRGLEWGIL